ncbi:MAG TPA: cyclic nucleotide-binding domain-containing protein [Gaiellaceae bacterium]|jgi:CRP-like cAMP-binding protein
MAARVEDLQAIPLFAQLEPEALQHLAETAKDVDVPAGQPLTQPGSPGSGMFFICDGTVEVEARESVRQLGPGDFFGELALLTEGGTRTARVRARTDVRCIAFDRVGFENLVREHPDIAATLLETALTRLD